MNPKRNIGVRTGLECRLSMEDIREMFDSAKKELRKRGGLVGWGACGVLGSIFGRRTGVGVLVGVPGERDFWGAGAVYGEGPTSRDH